VADFLRLPKAYRDFIEARGGPGLTSMDDRFDFLLIEMWNLLAMISNLAPGTPGTPETPGTPTEPGLGYPKNVPTFITGRKVIDVANEAIQLSTSSISIPDGFAIVIMAGSLNSGYVRVGPTKSDAESVNAFDSLGQGMSVGLFIKNVNSIYVTSDTAGDVVYFIVEKV
jgi:hypothetical protein